MLYDTNRMVTERQVDKCISHQNESLGVGLGLKELIQDYLDCLVNRLEVAFVDESVPDLESPS